MSNYVYTLDPSMWARQIFGISSERANDKMKILAILLPELMLEWGDKNIGAEFGTFTDMQQRLHVRIHYRDIHLATGWHRSNIWRVVNQLNAAQAISYRYFNERWNGHVYNLSYMALLDNLWMGTIYLPKEMEGSRSRNQKNYVPRCKDCASTLLQATGGIEYKCLSCGQIHVYFPAKDFEEWIQEGKEKE